MFGRLGTMKIVLPLQALGFGLAVFGDEIWIKAAGMGIMGLFHIKNSNSYTHMYELIEDDHRQLSATIMNAFDDGSIAIIAFATYMTKDLNLVFWVAWLFSLVASILYIILIPESPQWLFSTNSTTSNKGKKVIDYIAWFNGSTFRASSELEIDLE